MWSSRSTSPLVQARGELHEEVQYRLAPACQAMVTTELLARASRPWMGHTRCTFEIVDAANALDVREALLKLKSPTINLRAAGGAFMCFIGIGEVGGGVVVHTQGTKGALFTHASITICIQVDQRRMRT